MKGQLDFWFETGTEGGYWVFLEDDVENECPYDNMYVLKNGDMLRIYDDKDAIVFDGFVSLEELSTFKKAICNHWVHSIPIGVDSEIWFDWFAIKNYKAEFIQKA